MEMSERYLNLKKCKKSWEGGPSNAQEGGNATLETLDVLSSL